jgi:serine/threonine protein phosphatase PrpC
VATRLAAPVGDSRYYLLRGGELTQVSRDQTVAQDLVDSGVLAPAVALRILGSPNRNRAGGDTELSDIRLRPTMMNQLAFACAGVTSIATALPSLRCPGRDARG